MLSDTEKYEVLIGLVVERLQETTQVLQDGQEITVQQLLKELSLWDLQLLHVREGLQLMSENRIQESSPLQLFLTDLGFEPPHPRIDEVIKEILAWKSSDQFAQSLLEQAGVRVGGDEAVARQQLSAQFQMVDQASQFLGLVRNHIFADRPEVTVNELTQWVLDASEWKRDADILETISRSIYANDISPGDGVPISQKTKTKVDELHSLFNVISVRFEPYIKATGNDTVAFIERLGQMMNGHLSSFLSESGEWDSESDPIGALVNMLRGSNTEDSVDYAWEIGGEVVAAFRDNIPAPKEVIAAVELSCRVMAQLQDQLKSQGASDCDSSENAASSSGTLDEEQSDEGGDGEARNDPVPGDGIGSGPRKVPGVED